MAKNQKITVLMPKRMLRPLQKIAEKRDVNLSYEVGRTLAEIMQVPYPFKSYYQRPGGAKVIDWESEEEDAVTFQATQEMIDLLLTEAEQTQGTVAGAVRGFFKRTNLNEFLE